MSKHNKLPGYVTTQDLARELSLHDSRIRQICRKLQLGIVVGSHRFLNAKEAAAVRATPRANSGRKPKQRA